jgi:filamentous hemagglutinin family protein
MKIKNLQNLFIFIFFAVFPCLIFSLPKDQKVIYGCIQTEEKDNILSIKQNCPKAIIEWSEFSLLENEKINIFQQKNYTLVNKVISDKISEIYGSINAQGNFYLINQNGIIIGANGSINANKIFLSTLELKKEDFIKDNYHFLSDKDSEIINNGTIKSVNDIFIISTQIVNNSLITSERASANLIASNDVYLLDQKQNIVIKPNKNSKITNNGSIKSIEIKLLASRDNFDSYAISNKGLIEADSYSKKNGKVILQAKKGISEIAGEIKSKSENKSFVQVLGEKVHIVGNAKIDTSSDSNGGDIFIGGDFQGKNPEIQNSCYTFVSKDAFINASSNIEGNGGKIIIWSDIATDYYGNIKTTGGEIKGDGGFVEISGKENLIFRGDVNRKAFNGENGILLLDPGEINIVSGAPGGSSPTFPTSGNNYVISGGGAAASLTDGDLNNGLSSGPVTVNAGSILTVAAAAVISWSNTNTLTFISSKDTIIQSGASISNTSAAASPFTVMNFTANSSGANTTSRFGCEVLGAISTVNGNVLITATGSNIGVNPIGIYVTNSASGTGSITSTGSGSITLTGMGGNGNSGQNVGIFIENSASASQASVSSTGGGNIVFIGTGGGGNSTQNYGINIQGLITTSPSTGNITLTGASIATGGDNEGIKITGSVTTSSGLITMTGTGGNGAANNNYGINFTQNGAISASVSSNSGNLNLTGTSTSTGSSNNGIIIQSGAAITSTTGSITLDNTIGGGSGSASDNKGVLITGANSKIETTGAGGNIIFDTISSNGTINNNSAIEIIAGGQINCTNSGSITATNSIIGGTVATGVNNFGFYVDGANSKVSTNTGNISITAISNASANSGNAQNEGIEIEDQGLISSQGGAINLIGIGGIGASYGNHGIHVENASITNTSSGNITLQGTTSATGNDGISEGNDGVSIQSDGITTAVVSAVDGNITIQNSIGGGVGATSYNRGVMVTGSLAKIETTGAGNIIFNTISSNGTINNNSAIEIIAGGQINCTNSGNITATTSIIGGAAATGVNNLGFYVDGANSKVSTITGNISITATSNASASGGNALNKGIEVEDQGLISSQGGAINLIGIGGAGASYGNCGIHLHGSITNTSSGNITLQGTTVATGNDGIGEGNDGVVIHSDGITTAVVSAVDGNITIQNSTGGGVSATSYNRGVIVTGSLAKIETTGAGNIIFDTIQSNGLNTQNIALYLSAGALINCSVSGNITATNNIIGGQATATGDDNIGVLIEGSSSISTSSGSISITASSVALTNMNMGIMLADAGAISSTTGDITLNGTAGGNGASNNIGVHIRDNSARILGSGIISITGASMASGSGNHGVMVGRQSPSTGVGIIDAAGVNDLTQVRRPPL